MVLFARTRTAVWRDTGEHVLVLPLGAPQRQVTVLGGGSASVWRLLAVPRSLDHLRSRLAEASPPPTDEDLWDVLEALLRVGLVITTRDP